MRRARYERRRARTNARKRSASGGSSTPPRITRATVLSSKASRGVRRISCFAIAKAPSRSSPESNNRTACRYSASVPAVRASQLPSRRAPSNQSPLVSNSAADSRSSACATDQLPSLPREANPPRSSPASRSPTTCSDTWSRLTNEATESADSCSMSATKHSRSSALIDKMRAWSTAVPCNSRSTSVSECTIHCPAVTDTASLAMAARRNCNTRKGDPPACR